MVYAYSTEPAKFTVCFLIHTVRCSNNYTVPYLLNDFLRPICDDETVAREADGGEDLDEDGDAIIDDEGDEDC